MKRLIAAVVTGVALLAGPAPTPGAPVLHRHTVATSAERKIVLLGDSITAGGAIAPTDRLDVRLGYRLCGPWCGQPGYPTIINDGVGGQQLLHQPTALSVTFPGILATLSPGDIVVFAIGMNDLFDYQGDAAWVAAYSSMTNAATAAGVHFLVGQITPFTSAYAAHQPLRAQLNQWFLDLYGSLVLPYNDTLRRYDAGNTSWINPVFVNADGIHPDAWGTLYMADVLASKITAMGWLS